ncbi:MAG: hypothetical protein ABIK83_02115 [Candidatus Zixiibacteriota bacterium]
MYDDLGRVEFVYRTEFSVDRRVVPDEGYDDMFRLGAESTVWIRNKARATKIFFTLATESYTDSPRSFNPDGPNVFRSLHIRLLRLLDACVAYSLYPNRGNSSPSLAIARDVATQHSFDHEYSRVLREKTSESPLIMTLDLPLSAVSRTFKVRLEAIKRYCLASFSSSEVCKIFDYYRRGLISIDSPFPDWYIIFEHLENLGRVPKGKSTTVNSESVSLEFLRRFPQPFRHPEEDHMDTIGKYKEMYADLSNATKQYRDYLKLLIDDYVNSIQPPDPT